MRGALGPDRQLFQAFNAGGSVSRLVLGATWTEFSPASNEDLVQIVVPAGKTVYFASTATFPDLVDGAAVTEAHRELAVPFYEGKSVEAFDRDGATGPRFFFTADAAETVAVLFVRNA